MIYFCVKIQKDLLFRLHLTFFAPWLPWQQPPFLNFPNPSKAATHYGGYSYKVSSSFMKGIQNKFKSALFCFHGNCDKICPIDSDCLALSRSTGCGCCSYQASSISVWRITFICVFFICLAFWPLPWQRQPFWKKSTLNCLKGTTSHDIWYSYKVS